MEKFTKLTSEAIPLPIVNIDTDIIMPSDFLKEIKWAGLGKHAFHVLRTKPDGSIDSGSVFNDPRYADAKILISGDNFGCGSSREHAPRGIADMGIRCIIAPSFADIFAQNAFKVGLLLVALPQETVDAIQGAAEAGPLTIDLEEQEIAGPGGALFPFEYDEFRRYCLLNGLDQIGLTLQHETEISAFEESQKAREPWQYVDEERFQ